MKNQAERGSWLLALTITAWALVLAPAHAYLDPGTGSMILQAVVGGAMALALLARTYWGRITKFFRKDANVTDEADVR